MDIAKYLPLIFLISGCTTTATMSRHDINNMTIDCRVKDQQIAFLRSQYPSTSERLKNGLLLSSNVGYVTSLIDGTYQERMELNNGYYTSAIRLKITQIEDQCAKELYLKR